jgi:hypothetical protein
MFSGLILTWILAARLDVPSWRGTDWGDEASSFAIGGFEARAVELDASLFLRLASSDGYHEVRYWSS